jgi:hypothetical protein
LSLQTNSFIFSYFKLTEGVKPTLTELQKFEESPDGIDSECN